MGLRTKGGEISIERGPHPVEGDFARFGAESRSDPRTSVQSHWLARKPRTAMPPLFLFLLPLLFLGLHLFFLIASYSRYHLRTHPSRTLHILPLPYQVLLRFFFPPSSSIRSFIKYSCVDAHPVYMHTCIFESRMIFDHFYRASIPSSCPVFFYRKRIIGFMFD